MGRLVLLVAFGPPFFRIGCGRYEPSRRDRRRTYAPGKEKKKNQTRRKPYTFRIGAPNAPLIFRWFAVFGVCPLFGFQGAPGCRSRVGGWCVPGGCLTVSPALRRLVRARVRVCFICGHDTHCKGICQQKYTHFLGFSVLHKQYKIISA